MQYDIIEGKNCFHIAISGKPRKNEPLLAKRMLLPFFKQKNIRIIIDLKDLREFDSVFVLGILNSIRKEVGFLEGDLRICSLNPELLNYFQQNRLDKIFYIYKNKENAEKSVWRQDDGNLQFV
ncbi:MAG: STAS domain-containing protein [Deltaproteobacteria bacterium]|nr:STAS domain-containing protein [Deltaproteobacteria bacterium]